MPSARPVAVGVGLLGILFSFIPFMRLAGLLVLIGAVALFLCIYSFFCYRRYGTDGKESLSPPFEDRESADDF